VPGRRDALPPPIEDGPRSAQPGILVEGKGLQRDGSGLRPCHTAFLGEMHVSTNLHWKIGYVSSADLQPPPPDAQYLRVRVEPRLDLPPRDMPVMPEPVPDAFYRFSELTRSTDISGSRRSTNLPRPLIVL
jgi:hypothetical protein